MAYMRGLGPPPKPLRARALPRQAAGRRALAAPGALRRAGDPGIPLRDGEASGAATEPRESNVELRNKPESMEDFGPFWDHTLDHGYTA